MGNIEIQNYVKLLSIRIDHYESHLIQEINTSDAEEIENFIEKFKGIDGVKVIIVQMNTQELLTFDEVRRIIHNAHVFDYLRNLVANGNKMVTVNDDFDGVDIGMFVKYMLDVK